jgi:hypothetical protein
MLRFIFQSQTTILEYHIDKLNYLKQHNPSENNISTIRITIKLTEKKILEFLDPYLRKKKNIIANTLELNSDLYSTLTVICLLSRFVDIDNKIELEQQAKILFACYKNKFTSQEKNDLFIGLYSKELRSLKNLDGNYINSRVYQIRGYDLQIKKILTMDETIILGELIEKAFLCGKTENENQTRGELKKTECVNCENNQEYYIDLVYVKNKDLPILLKQIREATSHKNIFLLVCDKQDWYVCQQSGTSAVQQMLVKDFKQLAEIHQKYLVNKISEQMTSEEKDFVLIKIVKKIVFGKLSQNPAIETVIKIPPHKSTETQNFRFNVEDSEATPDAFATELINNLELSCNTKHR